VVATVIGTAIVIGMYKLFFETYVVYKLVSEQKTCTRAFTFTFCSSQNI